MLGGSLLVGIAQVLLLFAILAEVLTLFRGGLTNLLRFLYRDLSAHQDGDCLVVYLVYHRVEQVHRLQLVNQQRVFLFVAGILYGMFQIVQLAQVFFPCLVDDVQQDRLLK